LRSKIIERLHAAIASIELLRELLRFRLLYSNESAAYFPAIAEAY
jgi:hypothetical protein